MSSTHSEYEKNKKDVDAAQKTAQNNRIKTQQNEADNAKIGSYKLSINKLYAFITEARKEIVKQEELAKPYYAAYNLYVSQNKGQVGYPNSEPYKTQLANLQKAIDPYEQAIAKQKTNIQNAYTNINTYKAEIAKLQKSVDTRNGVPPKPDTSSGTPTAPQGKKVQFSDDYKYNAPMVREAYFGDQSFVNSILEGKYVDQGFYTDARQAWQGVTGGRGTIQMDQWFLSTISQNEVSSFNQGRFDLQKYGFKFLYNPQTVSMAWGLMSSMDPFFESTGKDKFQVIATQLMSSTVSFELLLNRILDFNYIDENGIRASFKSNVERVNTTNLSGIDNASKIIQPSKFPYPQFVSDKDAAEIYNKGTMHDLEYLFRTLNGPDANFESLINGDTADRGWMRPTIVELHLGQSLRYRVRISEFAVNHIIFNARMVPILSSVRLTCSRFADGPGTYIYGEKNIGGVSAPPSGLPALRDTVPGYGR